MAAHAVHSAKAQLNAAPRMSVCGFIEGMTPEGGVTLVFGRDASVFSPRKRCGSFRDGPGPAAESLRPAGVGQAWGRQT